MHSTPGHGDSANEPMISFREVQPDDAGVLLQWRRQPRVARMMLTAVEHGVADQRRWLENMSDVPWYHHWIFQIRGVDAGLVSLSDINAEHKSLAWGYYVGNDDALGLGAMVPPCLYNWLFSETGVRVVHAEVLESNRSVIRMHLFHGHQRVLDRDRLVTKPDGTSELLLCLRLEAATWRELGRFQAVTASFPLQGWTSAPEPLRGG